MANMGLFYTIAEGDIGKPTISAFGKTWTVTDWIGRILPLDVGKRVYMRGHPPILQVENNEQRDKRLS